jgi:hypothetical protein
LCPHKLDVRYTASVTGQGDCYLFLKMSLSEMKMKMANEIEPTTQTTDQNVPQIKSIGSFSPLTMDSSPRTKKPMIMKKALALKSSQFTLNTSRA